MANREPIDDALTHSVIGAFFEVYNTLGFGFLEHVYAEALEYEIRARGHSVAREVPVVVYYKGMALTTQRLDMIVDGVLIIELKSTYRLPPAAPRQTYNYVRATDLDRGLLFHFGPEPKIFRLECRKPRVQRYKVPARYAGSAQPAPTDRDVSPLNDE